MDLVSSINKQNSEVLWREIRGSAVLGKPEETIPKRHLNPHFVLRKQGHWHKSKKTAAGKSEIKIQFSAQKKELSSKWSFV